MGELHPRETYTGCVAVMVGCPCGVFFQIRGFRVLLFVVFAPRHLIIYFLIAPSVVVFGTGLVRVFQVNIPRQAGILHFLLDMMKKRFSPQLLALWKSATIGVIWLIWTVRNKHIFEGVRPNVFSAISYLWSSLRSCPVHAPMNNSVSDLLILHNLHVRGIPRKAPVITSVTWLPPPEGVIKMNSDGSAMGAPGVMACGAVFRDWKGRVLGSFSKQMEQGRSPIR
ncbi:hypothetical protein Salmi_Mp120 (mitochondrion) [Salvia miltiorrhiza]|uniref:RNase H type-1 domain-containing protein n=1 Tax=Salvia miltiorrhiza TaxID=226208 RepID=V9P5E3_SALMI|nr:hypothetical protein Salmi_Mp120 [Salvia miltiorrhiza]AGU16648.1 hypothetical protein Salmi_Mp120 [Salvia miltiorrhiza]